MPPPPPAPTWSGFYVGVNGGYGGDRFVYPFDVNAPVLGGLNLLNGSASLTSSGFLAGGQIGYNYQFPTSNIVLGVEADADWTSIRGQLGLNANVPAGGIAGPAGASLSAVAGSHVEYFGTARARLGYAFNNIMPYVTGGFAWGETNSYYNINAALLGAGGGLAGSEHNGQDGWTAGAGLEYQITPNLTFKTEYLYVNLGTHTLLAGDIGNLVGVAPVGVNFDIRERTTMNVVRAGLDYKFDWFAPPAPVVAKY
jgi:outer membrane immunogenic protein